MKITGKSAIAIAISIGLVAAFSGHVPGASAAEAFTKTFDVSVDKHSFAACVQKLDQLTNSGVGQAAASGPRSGLLSIDSLSAFVSPQSLEITIVGAKAGSTVTWVAPDSWDNETLIADAIACAKDREYVAWIEQMKPEEERIRLTLEDRESVPYFTGQIARATFNSDR